jgi:hypothetical protein
VAPCNGDTACASGWLCTGREDFGLADRKTYTYCRPAAVDAGGSCKAVKDGCKAGLNCFNDQCEGPCSADADCPDAERCLSVVVGFMYDAEKLFKLCVPANVNEGQICDDGKEQFCARGLTCLKGICRKPCGNDDDCDAPGSCSAFSMVLPAPGKRHNVYYCEAGTLNEGDACEVEWDLPPEKTCRRGLICDSAQKKCAVLCKAHEDCSDGRTCTGEEWDKNALTRLDEPHFRFCK